MAGRAVGALAALALAGGLTPAVTPTGTGPAVAEPVPARGTEPVDRSAIASRVVGQALAALHWRALGRTAVRHPRKVPDWSNARYRRAARKRRNQIRSRRSR